MTPEDRAKEIVEKWMRELPSTPNPDGALEYAIAAALRPSEAVVELIRWCEWEAMNEHTAHDDDRAYLPWTECPAEQCKNAHQRIAAVKKEFGL